LGRLEAGLALDRSFGTASATPLFTSLDRIFIVGSYRYQYCRTKVHCMVIFAIVQLSCLETDDALSWEHVLGII